MPLRRICLTTTAVAALALLGRPAPAQTITDPASATAARDSVLHHADRVRQQLESRTAYVQVRHPHLGRRRLITRGYGQQLEAGAKAPARQVLLWKRVSWQRRSGSTEETFRGYGSRQVSLRESRHNGQLTFLEVNRYRQQVFVSKPVLVQRGWLTRNGYVHWSNKTYILPAANYRPADGRP